MAASARRSDVSVNPMGELVRRIRTDYSEMPGLRLTLRQARRLWAVDELVCEAVLTALVDARFLTRSSDGRFVMAPPPACDRAAGALWKASDSTPFHTDPSTPPGLRHRARQTRACLRLPAAKSASRA